MLRKFSIVAGLAALLAVSASDFAAARSVHAGRSGGGHRSAGVHHNANVHRNTNVHRNVNVNRNVNVHRNVNVNRNVHVGVVRPWVRRPYFGTIVGGVALGTMIAVTAMPPVPAPGLCWYWADASQTQGYWDYCQ